MTIKDQQDVDAFTNLLRLEAIEADLAKLAKDGGLPPKIEEALRLILTQPGGETPEGARRHVWDRLGRRWQTSIEEGARLGSDHPIEAALVRGPEKVVDLLYTLCRLTKTEPNKFNDLAEALKAHYEDAPPPHVVKTLRGEIVALQEAKRRLQAMLDGKDPIERMPEGDAFEALVDDRVAQLAYVIQDKDRHLDDLKREIGDLNLEIDALRRRERYTALTFQSLKDVARPKGFRQVEGKEVVAKHLLEGLQATLDDAWEMLRIFGVDPADRSEGVDQADQADQADPRS